MFDFRYFVEGASCRTAMYIAMIGKNKGKSVVVVVTVLIYHINSLHSVLQTVLDTYVADIYLISNQLFMK